jgi:predicted DCC family thiol-disulfide oxidoreductase YuxK
MTAVILFDGHCGLCRKSMRVLAALDWLGQLSFVNFHDETKRMQIAPRIPFADLDRVLHVIFPDGRTLTGFDGLRQISWLLPPLWPLAPLLYLPGVAPIGRTIYRRIARRRQRCTHEGCV